MKILTKLLKGLAIFVGLLALVIGGAILFLSKKLPSGETGPAADALAHQIEEAVHRDAWERTGAIRWVFGGRQKHLWDRSRSLVRVSWKENVVLYDLTRNTGVAYQNGKPADDKSRAKLVERAYALFCNDSFWLNPLVKLFDAGVTRSVTEPSGRKALLISYSSGGVTPGDSYLWLLDDKNVPHDWQMWVSIIQLKGIGTSWENWQTLSTGALVASEHKLAGLVPLKLTEIAAAPTLAELEPGPDPFAPLFETAR